MSIKHIFWNRTLVILLAILLTTSMASANTVTLIQDDVVGDIANGFVDIVQGEVSADDTSLTVRVQLRNIPNQLLFDKENVPDGINEYGWFLNVDMGGSDDYNIFVGNHKSPGSLPHYDSLINGTNHFVIKSSDSSRTIYPIIGQVYAHVNGNNLIMTTNLLNNTVFDNQNVIIKIQTFDYVNGTDFLDMNIPPIDTTVPTPTVSPTVGPMSGNIVRGSSFGIISIVTLLVCLIIISLSRLKIKRK